MLQYIKYHSIICTVMVFVTARFFLVVLLCFQPNVQHLMQPQPRVVNILMTYILIFQSLSYVKGFLHQPGLDITHHHWYLSDRSWFLDEAAIVFCTSYNIRHDRTFTGYLSIIPLLHTLSEHLTLPDPHPTEQLYPSITSGFVWIQISVMQISLD